MPIFIECASCGAVEAFSSLQNSVKPCRCGSTDRRASIDEDGRLRGFNRVREKRPGMKRRARELTSGDSRFEETRQWNKRIRLVDRVNNRYIERIYDPKTPDSPIRSVDEPLSEHRERGSAKKK